VKFRGNEVLIDNLEVFLSSSTATIEVPRDFATIQQAIDSASYGDIIEVSPGTYKGDGSRDIDFKGKTITVRSSSGPDRTTIDCTGGEGHRGFYFHQGESRDSVLRGFTIKGAILSGSDIPSDNSSWNSSPAHPVGGGIYCEYSSPSIIDCVITQCAAELGGGIGSVGGSPLIIDCTIEQCQAGGFGQAQSGGYGAGIGLIKNSDVRIVNCIIERNIGYNDSFGAGVYCWKSRLVLANCDISFNNAQGNVTGGGLYCGGSSSQATLERCIVSNNTAGAGGGIFSDSSARTNITNCTIADNNLSASQKSLGGGVHVDSSYIAIRNSIVWYNDGLAVALNGSLSSNPVLYSNIEGYHPGQGNIDLVPRFVSRGSDYHLRSLLGRYDSGQWVTDSLSNHSPCIDAGDPQDPIGAEPFPNNKRINMGAYGGTSQASKSIGPLIFHVDGSNGNNYNSGLSRSQAFRNIQKAVDEAYEGDTIMVWPGTYREAVFVIGKAITIQSADDAAVVMAPSNDPIAFTFQFAESSRSVLRNFVITNCGEAAIFCNSASPELTNLTIVNNQFGITAYGGSDPSITNCILWNNGKDETSDLEQCRARYSCLSSLQPGDSNLGNISKDPVFADINNGDYHLQSEYGRYLPNSRSWTMDSQTGPCIDAGDPSMHTGREQKSHGGRVNMGAYGGTPFASKSGPSW
jgi:parallel beta-helix repeat protein